MLNGKEKKNRYLYYVYTTNQWKPHLWFLVFNIEWMRAT